VGAQRILVEVDLHLARRAAIGVRKLGACDRGELRPDEVLGEIEELDLRKRVAGQRQLDDRNARGVVGQDDRRRGPLGKLLENCLRNRRDLRLCGVDVHARLEEDLDDAHAGKRLRLDMLDVVDGGRERSLVWGDDPAGHVIRREAGIAPHRRDDRDADIGKDVSRGPDRRQRAENHHQNRHHDERVGTRER
jgi:hypothetical protein